MHCDLAGPINVIGKRGYKFAITFVDDYSGIIMVYLLKRNLNKGEEFKRMGLTHLSFFFFFFFFFFFL